MNKQLALEIVGGLSKPSKMPCSSYSIPAQKCITGSSLRDVKDSICSKCYALKGMYGFPVVREALQRRFESLSDPRWVEAMVFLITNVEKSGYFRWHDSGDIQSPEHLEMIAEVCRLTPNVQHWLPTREYVGKDGKPSILAQFFANGSTIPSNLVMRLSALMINAAPPKSVARRYGVFTSGVVKQGFTCPAPNQGNKCLDCRACWSKDVENINYKFH